MWRIPVFPFLITKGGVVIRMMGDIILLNSLGWCRSTSPGLHVFNKLVTACMFEVQCIYTHFHLRPKQPQQQPPPPPPQPQPQPQHKNNTTHHDNNTTTQQHTIAGFAQIWFPLLIFCSVSLISRLVVLGCLLILLGLMRNSEKAWLPYFCRSGQRDTSLEEFNREVEGWSPLFPEVDLPRLTGQMLADVVQRKVPLLVVLLDGGVGS